MHTYGLWYFEATSGAAKKMRQNASQEPIVEMSKAEIEEKHLSDAVIMPSDCDEAFSKWWRGIAPEKS